MGLKSYIFIGLYLFASFVFAGVWQTEDQKAFHYYKKRDFNQAYQFFENKSWKAAAAYKAKNYQAAIQLYKKAKNADDFYNLANSLALLGDYLNSVKAYKKALNLDPSHQDAKFNLEIIEKLLQKKQDEQSKSKSKDKKQEQSKEESQQSSNDTQKNQDKNKGKANKPPKPEESKEKNEHAKDKNEDKQSQEEKTTQQTKQTMTDKQSDKEFSEWLKLIENDPEGLLRQKFLRDYQRDLESHKL